MTEPSLRERYVRDPWSRQLGNLASTLARLSRRPQDIRHDDTTTALLREAALLIEWSAPHVPARLLVDLARAQRELCMWARLWPVNPARPILSLRARQLSESMLEASGLVPRSGDESHARR